MDTQKNNAAQASLPDRLRQLIQEKGKPLRDIAAETDFSIASLSAWQSGKKVPQADSILLLCKYFNVSADYLLGLSDVRKVDANIKAAVDYTCLTEKAAFQLRALCLNSIHFVGNCTTPSNVWLSMLLESYTMNEIIKNISDYFTNADMAKKQKERIITLLEQKKTDGTLYEYLFENETFREYFTTPDMPETFDELKASKFYKYFVDDVDWLTTNELCRYIIDDEHENFDEMRDVAELHAQKAITRFFDKMQATIEQGTNSKADFFAKMSESLDPTMTPEEIERSRLYLERKHKAAHDILQSDFEQSTDGDEKP